MHGQRVAPECLRRVPVAQVDGERVRAFAQLPRKRLHAFGVNVVHEHVAAGGHDGPRGRRTDAAGCAGEEHDPAGQIDHPDPPRIHENVTMTQPGSQDPSMATTPIATHGADATDALLDVRGLSKSFRGLQALTDYELRLAAGTIHGVIGPNGAGKTTLFHLLSGFLRPTAGSIRFDGRDITGEPSYRVARLGIARTFQNIRLFGDLPVIDNVKAGLQAHAPRSIVRTLLYQPWLPARGTRAHGARHGAPGPVRPRAARRPPGAASARTATSDGWRSPARSATGRACCSSTSRMRA